MSHEWKYITESCHAFAEKVPGTLTTAGAAHIRPEAVRLVSGEGPLQEPALHASFIHLKMKESPTDMTVGLAGLSRVCVCTYIYMRIHIYVCI